ncbi:MAG: DsbA family protein [Candidatus Brennerbacteria bacterium]
MEETMQENEVKKRDVLLPASIIIAGVLVAGAVIWSLGKRAEGPVLTAGLNTPGSPNIAAMRAVDESDHVRGSRDAKVTIVEYSDFECPYCKKFHDMMKGTLAAYGEDVAWAYRQYPIEGLHAKAVKESEAAECTAELGGNDVFWRFADRIFEVTPSNDGLDPAELPVIGEFAGVSKNVLETCLATGAQSTDVAATVAEAEGMGIRGTPYAVFVAKSQVDENDFAFLAEINQQFAIQYPGQPAPFVVDEESDRVGMSGAFPSELVGQIIDVLIK